MSCPHLSESVGISRVDVELIRRESQRPRANGAVRTGSALGKGTRSRSNRLAWPDAHDGVVENGNWNCIACGTSLSPWLCLFCGLIHCGRYVSQHGLIHYKDFRAHCLSIDCHDYAVFCYACDEFVMNDTSEGHIESVRRCLRQHNDARYYDHNYSTPTVQSLARRPQPSVAVGEAAAAKRARLTPTDDNDDDDDADEDADVSAPSRAVRLRGLKNLGNTCFMNAVLQSLNNIDEFGAYFSKLPEISQPKNGHLIRYNTRRSAPSETFLAEELRKTLVALRDGGTTAIAADALFSVVWKLVPRFQAFAQQDAHEFLRCVLDRLNSELRRLPNGGGVDSVVTAIFQGVLQSQVTCLTCKTSSRKLDPFLDLSLDLASLNGKAKNEDLKLVECLNRFFAKEVLDDREQYFCEKCRVKRPSTKQFMIRQLPNVLCLHLKRFRWSHHERRKLNNFVEFPLNGLCMSPFTISTTRQGARGSVYDLAAIVVHFGSGCESAVLSAVEGRWLSVSSGHYTAFARRGAQSWHHFNDSSVRPCAERLIGEQRAYILFYVRRKADAAAPAGPALRLL